MYRVYRILTLLVSFLSAGLSFAQAPTPVHAYELNNSLADTYGGPAMVNNGATLGATGLTFAPNQGPSLSNWVTGTATSSNYSIEMRFQITDINGFRKFIDFANRTVDQGLYNINGNFTFYNYGVQTNNVFSPNTSVHMILARDSGTSLITSYINGVQSFSFTDSSNFGIFSGTGNIMQFFQDDAATGFTEASGGFVDYIRIYDHAVSAGEAAALFVVPEPSTIVLGSLAVVGFVSYRRFFARRKRSVYARQAG